MKKLFTDRFGQGLPRTKEELDAESRDALWGILSARIAEEWFGYAFNEQCGDGYAYAGTATGRLQRDMAAYKILWPPDQIGTNPPATDGQVFDAVEYSYQHIPEPGEPSYHSPRAMTKLRPSFGSNGIHLFYLAFRNSIVRIR